MLVLRDYQVEAVEAVINEFTRHPATLMIMATGTGKTVAFAHIIKRIGHQGRVLVLAHREELLTQAQSKIAEVTGLWPELEKAESYANLQGSFAGRTGDIVVSTVQTQISGQGEWRRMHRFNPNEFALVIIDEAHRSAAASYRRIIEYYQTNPNLKILGCTATPKRTDRKALGQIFQSVAYERYAADFVHDGWLVPVNQAYTTIHDLDLSTCRTSGDDLHQGDLARIMEFAEPLNKVAAATIEQCGDRKTIVFCVSVDQARMTAELLNQHKPKSAWCVTGKTPDEERTSMMKAYRRGDFQYLVNVAVATEGLDVPDCSAVVMAKPTKSNLVYSQSLGRGMRPLAECVEGRDTPELRRGAIGASAKPNLLVVDFVGNSGRHKLVRAVDVLGGKYSDKVRELAERKLQEQGKPDDVTKALEQAQTEVSAKEAEAAARLAKQRERAKFTVKWIDPFNSLDIAPSRGNGWGGHTPASDKQIALLAKWKIDGTQLSRIEATRVISRLFARREQGLCTPGQAACLKKRGYATENMTKVEASRIMDALAANGWRALA